MAMSRSGLRASRLAATAMPAAPPPMITISCVASATSTGVFPPLTMRRTTPLRSWPALAARSMIWGSGGFCGVRPACQSAHIVVERMPVRQNASTGFGNSDISAPKA